MPAGLDCKADRGGIRVRRKRKACPAVGAAGQAERKRMRAFEGDKELRKQKAIDQSQEYKKTLSEARERREKYIQMGVSAENEIARLKAELAAYKPQEPAQVADMPGYGEQEEALRAAIQEAERVVSQMAGESAAIRAEITGKVGELRQADPGG